MKPHSFWVSQRFINIIGVFATVLLVIALELSVPAVALSAARSLDSVPSDLGGVPAGEAPAASADSANRKKKNKKKSKGNKGEPAKPPESKSEGSHSLVAAETAKHEAVSKGKKSKKADDDLCDRAVAVLNGPRARCTQLQEAKAYQLLESAASRGHQGSLFQLGFRYRNAIGVHYRKLDYHKSVTYFEKAISLKPGIESKFSRHGLALAYLQGRGIEQDSKKAMNHFVLASNLGSGNSLTHIALIYAFGVGALQSKKLAVEWLNKLNPDDITRVNLLNFLYGIPSFESRRIYSSLTLSLTWTQFFIANALSEVRKELLPKELRDYLVDRLESFESEIQQLENNFHETRDNYARTPTGDLVPIGSMSDLDHDIENCEARWMLESAFAPGMRGRSLPFGELTSILRKNASQKIQALFADAQAKIDNYKTQPMSAEEKQAVAGISESLKRWELSILQFMRPVTELTKPLAELIPAMALSPDLEPAGEGKRADLKVDTGPKPVVGSSIATIVPAYPDPSLKNRPKSYRAEDVGEWLKENSEWVERNLSFANSRDRRAMVGMLIGITIKDDRVRAAAAGLYGAAGGLSVAESIRTLQVAAEGKDPEAQYYLADILRSGEFGVDKNETKALDLYWKAALNRDSGTQILATLKLAEFHQKGECTVKPNEATAIKLYEKASNLGSSEALFKLGQIFEAKEDWASAVAWHQKAASKGFSKSQIRLGEIYTAGRVPIAEAHANEALRLITMAAENGSAISQRKLGYLHLEGLGVRRDERIARKWLEKAQLQNDSLARYYWGRLHAENDRGPEDQKVALDAFRSVAAAENFPGNINQVKSDLAHHYLTASSIRDIGRASTLYQELADLDAKADDSIQGDAQFYLAWIHMMRGADAQNSEVQALLERAKENGEPKAISFLNSVGGIPSDGDFFGDAELMIAYLDQYIADLEVTDLAQSAKSIEGADGIDDAKRVDGATRASPPVSAMTLKLPPTKDLTQDLQRQWILDLRSLRSKVRADLRRYLSSDERKQNLLSRKLRIRWIQATHNTLDPRFQNTLSNLLLRDGLSLKEALNYGRSEKLSKTPAAIACAPASSAAATGAPAAPAGSVETPDGNLGSDVGSYAGSDSDNDFSDSDSDSEEYKGPATGPAAPPAPKVRKRGKGFRIQEQQALISALNQMSSLQKTSWPKPKRVERAPQPKKAWNVLNHPDVNKELLSKKEDSQVKKKFEELREFLITFDPNGDLKKIHDKFHNYSPIGKGHHCHLSSSGSEVVAWYYDDGNNTATIFYLGPHVDPKYKYVKKKLDQILAAKKLAGI